MASGAMRIGARIAGLLAAALCTLVQAQTKPNPSWPKTLTLGTASPGGTYVIYGRAWAELVNRKAGTHITIQETQGPNQNIALTDARLTDFGMTTMGVAQQAWTGKGEWTRGKSYRNLRATFPMYNTPFHIVALEKSGIRSVKDLHGRKSGIGPKSGTCGTYFPLIFRAIGVETTIRNGTAADMAASLQDGLIEAFPFCAGVPIAAYQELEAANRVRFFTFNKSEIQRIKGVLPELTDAVIPKGTYKQLAEDQPTIGVFNFGLAHKDVPEDLVYLVVKTVLENVAELARAHPAAKETVIENWKRNTVIPFHPGALRYLRERGISVPASLQAS
jgi:TRAP transporter TAXI family solute receptor